MRALKWFEANFERTILACCMALMAALIFVQVIMRYVFENSLVWSEELVRWLFIWTIWVGIAYAFRSGDHIRITMLSDRLSSRARHWLEKIICGAMIAFFLWIGWLGVQQATSPIVARQSSVVLHWPFSDTKVSLTWLYATLPFGSFLSAIRLLQHLFAHPGDRDTIAHGEV
ncbi:TRAP transporter small permease [Marinovum sp. 2_MG-2023]|uniref:TRAP transporter small permease n=1 Tax=unclassified Marinovum TaxID=2647166 RepID=UPI0026E3BCFD|nr:MULTISPECIES: TRAP transporter small permease [unclassified Marinovum]MDO6732383.1 TRAP transporter small permease [Marinovum sp. 2_MG-2023]MDO6781700.1 TRAP transporter small permease [Marinovum sp. 1_MG-2023]